MRFGWYIGANPKMHETPATMVFPHPTAETRRSRFGPFIAAHYAGPTSLPRLLVA